MASRQRQTPKPPSAQTPYIKSPLQLQQWAAFEAITAERETEVTTKNQTDTSVATLVARSDSWGKAETIRSFVALVALKMPVDADEATKENAAKWQEWALGIADSIDPTLGQVEAFFAKPGQ
jgi:hypothetical protein